MPRKAKVILGVALIAGLASIVYARWFSPLAVFSRQISQADRAVVMTPHPPSVRITITGQDLQRIVGMVSFGRRDRAQYACCAEANVEFFKGGEVVGKTVTCSRLMWIDGGQYRDDTGLLESLVVNPLHEAERASQIQQTETK